MSMLQTIIAKSDQLNADDLIGTTKTITIRDVKFTMSEAQPASFYYDGDEGKPYKPCKSMRRVIVNAWGPDSADYIGRSLTLFNDPTVIYGKDAVGGIRISHMSHIDSDLTMPLAEKRGLRKAYTVRPITSRIKGDPAEQWTRGFLAKLATMYSLDEVQALQNDRKVKLTELEKKRPDLFKEIAQAVADKEVSFQSGDLIEQEKAAEGETSTTDELVIPELWQQLKKRAEDATTEHQIEVVRDEYDLREAEIPLADRGAVLTAIDDAIERISAEEGGE